MDVRLERTFAETTAPRAAMLAAEMAEQCRPPEDTRKAEKEPSTTALYAALLEEPNSSPLAETIEFAAGFRLAAPGASVPETVGVVRSALITYLLSVNKEFSDDTLTTPADWKGPLADINLALRDPTSYEAMQLEYNLVTRKVATTLPSRYTSSELMMHILRDRFPDGVRMLDIGSSVMAGANNLMRKDEYPLSFEQVAAGKEDLTEKTNRILALPSLLRECVCVDIQPIYDIQRDQYDAGIVAWAVGSLRPSERNNPEFMERFRSLTTCMAPGVTFSSCNLLDTAKLGEFREAHGDSFDLVTIRTAIHQMLPKDRLKMLNIVDGISKPNAVILVGDFAYLSPESSAGPVPFTSLRTASSWHDKPYRYKDLVIDKALPVKGLQEVGSFQDNSRCTRLRLGAGKLAVDGNTATLQTLIERADA